MTERKYLKGRTGGKKLINMEKVYVQLDNGRSVEEVANEFGVSKSTLYRRHREYQEEVKALNRTDVLQDVLPPLPNDIEM